MKSPLPSCCSALALVLIGSCGPRPSMESYQDVIARQEKAAAGAVFPRVISPGWHVMGDGRPEMDVSGFSRVSYVRDGAPKDVVEIFYHGPKNARITSDDKSTATVMGQVVQTYPSGNEDVAFATQPILLTAPNGKSAYYSFQFNNEHLYRSRAIPQFGW